MESKKYRITRTAPTPGGLETGAATEERVVSILEGYSVPEGAVEVPADTPLSEWAEVKPKEKK